MKKKRKNFFRPILGVFIVMSSLFQLGCTVFGGITVEVPKYNSVDKDGDFEIRQYKSYVVAKTTAKGDFKAAQNKAFRKLAGYIFGKNLKNQKVAMTAPVTQTESEKIAMTAPVTQTQKGDSWSMTFMMPSEYKMEDLPQPEDKSVVFEQVPEKLIATVQYTWLGSRERFRRQQERLVNWLKSKPEYKVAGEAKYAGYNPPWTIPFLRTNEVWIEVTRQNPPTN